MSLEIERKFLIKKDRIPLFQYVGQVRGKYIRQGFLSSVKERVVRVRITGNSVGNSATLTIKGQSQGISKLEYEYDIPVEDAEKLLNEVCEPAQIEKTRYKLPCEHTGLVWEVDEFHGDNDGLIVAEIELEEEDQVIVLPEWIDKEVSDDPRYYNSNLIKHPYKDWE